MRWTLAVFILLASPGSPYACDDHNKSSGCSGGCVDLGPDPSTLLRRHNDASLTPADVLLVMHYRAPTALA